MTSAEQLAKNVAANEAYVKLHYPNEIFLSTTDFLTPEYGLYKVQETDALIDGLPFEFRNITGQIRKIELRFGEAKKKGNEVNVFISIEIDVNIDEVKRRINLVLGRHPEYTGKIIVSLRGKQPYFWDTCTIRAN